MEVTVDLGSAKDFVEWDEQTNNFVVHENDATEEYVGDHEICMKVSHFNETYREEYEDCFTLTIHPKPVEPDVTWTPPE